jgi:hypothetical protein
MSRSFPSSRGSSAKDMEQRITIKFDVKIGNSASETLALLTLAHDEHALKKLNGFEWHSLFKD